MAGKTSGGSRRQVAARETAVIGPRRWSAGNFHELKEEIRETVLEDPAAGRVEKVYAPRPDADMLRKERKEIDRLFFFITTRIDGLCPTLSAEEKNALLQQVRDLAERAKSIESSSPLKEFIGRQPGELFYKVAEEHRCPTIEKKPSKPPKDRPTSSPPAG